MYSHPLEPHPSTTAVAPEFLTANLSPACPEANKEPLVDPYMHVLPIMVFSFELSRLFLCGLIIILAPDKLLPT